MPEILKPATMPAALRGRLAVLQSKTKSDTIEPFGVFLDTHRDQPHIGSFKLDIHRGMCVPTIVNYHVPTDSFKDPKSELVISRHDKHMFLPMDVWSAYVAQALMSGEGIPEEVPTNVFRDPRTKTYLLRSFRQVVMEHWRAL